MKRKKGFVHSISEIKITYRNRVKKQDRIQLKTSTDSVKIIQKIYGKTIDYKEQFYAVYLNHSLEFLGYSHISTGGITSTIVDVRVVFQTALKVNATSMILFHNHPSGNNYPSEYDIKLTSKIKAAGKIMDIQLVDHIIITSDNYYSLLDNGKL